MKKIFYSFAAIALMGLGMTSCQKENTQQLPMSFNASIDRDGSNAKVELNNENYPEWENEDSIYIGYQGSTLGAIYSCLNNSIDCRITVFYYSSHQEPVGDLAYAIYPASIATVYDDQQSNEIVLPATQTSPDGRLTRLPMSSDARNFFPENIEYNINNSLDLVLPFQNICGVLRIHLQQNDVAISSITLSANEHLNGVYDLAYQNSKPVITESTTRTNAFSNTTTLNLITPQSIASGKDFYIYLPAGDYTNMRLTFTNSLGHVCTKSCAALTVHRSEIIPISISGNMEFQVPPAYDENGALPSLFSVSSSKQVRFSRGNMQYTTTGTHVTNYTTTSRGTWRFAEHQYDYVGEGNVNKSTSYEGWIDLFSWSSSGYSMSPWYIANLAGGDIAGTDRDWGVYNAISNGGNQPGLWRTLTKPEMYYLLYSRTDYSNKKGMGKIQISDNESVSGLILLPDSWTLPEGCSFNGLSNINANNSFDNNTYTLDQWTLMENAGAVFLPAAGVDARTSNNYSAPIYDIGTNGSYWLSDYNTQRSYNNLYAWALTFFTWNGSGYLELSDQGQRNRGYSVRVVQDNN